MKLFILTQDKKSLILVKDKIFINTKNQIIHGKGFNRSVLGKYKSKEKCEQVLLEITKCINRIHQFTDENNNIVMAFASLSELYEMPTK